MSALATAAPSFVLLAGPPFCSWTFQLGPLAGPLASARDHPCPPLGWPDSRHPSGLRPAVLPRLTRKPVPLSPRFCSSSDHSQPLPRPSH